MIIVDAIIAGVLTKVIYSKIFGAIGEGKTTFGRIFCIYVVCLIACGYVLGY